MYKSGINYGRTKAEKEDQYLSWIREDTPFFASGACHVLAYTFKELYPELDCEIVFIRPKLPHNVGNHVYIKKGEYAFDFSGWTIEKELLSVFANDYRSKFKDWDYDLVILSEPIEVFCDNNRHRRPEDFYGDVVQRAKDFIQELAIKNAEFQNEKLAQIYENFNQFSEDEDFWMKTIEGLGVKDITDFGCGTGLFTQKLSESAYSVRGIEPALPMIEQAKQKDSSNETEYIHGGYEKLKGFTTDLVLMTSHVSQFITDKEERDSLLNNAYDVLNQGGYILFDSKNPLLEPWKNYTRENYNRTVDTKLGKVNMQIEVSKIRGNIITHNIYYTFLDTGEELISSNTLIYKTKQEIEKDLITAGFKIVKVYGDWNGDEYTDTSSEIIFLAQKV